MKIKTALLAAALAVPAFATTAPAVNTYKAEVPASVKRVSGALQVGYATNYTGRGYVVSHSVAQGDSVLNSALKLNYDFGKQDQWSASITLAYTIPTSGHTLYGNPNASFNTIVGMAMKKGYSYDQAVQYAQANVGKAKIKQLNIENEFAVVSALNYKPTSGLWSVSFGHDYIHGGLLGVMAKHYAKNGASCVNEFFVHPEWNPYKWLSMGVKTSYSVSGLCGWWFEPTITLKAPIVGTPEDIKVAGLLTFGMTVAADYFDNGHYACDNGTQAFYIKFQTPWFVKKNLIVTPGVSFNWAGPGAIAANKCSEFRAYSGNYYNYPFRNFGVVGSLSVTYTF
ncbi:MAG: hypothetical protein IKV82_08180 [Akkermansia sp.]|nr:hypothetical protein [Akkermansia sp.]